MWSIPIDFDHFVVHNFKNIFKEVGNDDNALKLKRIHLVDEFDGWYYRNGTPLSSSIPAYYTQPWMVMALESKLIIWIYIEQMSDSTHKLTDKIPDWQWWEILNF